MVVLFQAILRSGNLARNPFSGIRYRVGRSRHIVGMNRQKFGFQKV